MELWELVRRLLADAVGAGKSFEAAVTVGTYYSELLAMGREVRQTYADFSDIGEAVAEDLESEGFIRQAGIPHGTPAVIGAVERTDRGDELLEMLSRRGMVAAFEGMQVDIEAAAVARVMHQFNS